jgi:hypothetical protein
MSIRVIFLISHKNNWEKHALVRDVIVAFSFHWFSLHIESSPDRMGCVGASPNRQLSDQNKNWRVVCVTGAEFSSPLQTRRPIELGTNRLFEACSLTENVYATSDKQRRGIIARRNQLCCEPISFCRSWRRALLFAIQRTELAFDFSFCKHPLRGEIYVRQMEQKLRLINERRTSQESLNTIEVNNFLSALVICIAREWDDLSDWS